MLFLLLLFLSSAAIYENTELIIISPPFSVNASLGSTAEFNCTCHYCVGQFWLVNGVSANYQVNYNKGVRSTMSSNNGNNRSYTLTMPASVQLNGSTIECVAYNESSQSTSAAKLLVQGLLSGVANVAITQFNSTTLILQYLAPFTLAGIPILYYNILILPTNLSVNITDTQFHLHISEYCISYNISITPWNIVGMGNATTLSDIVIHQVPAITMPQLIQEYKSNSETLHVYYEVQYNTSCKGTVPQSVSLTINQEKDHYCSLVSPVANNCTITTADIDNNVNVTINITEVLGYGANYVINMSLFNANNIKTEDFIFNISRHISRYCSCYNNS
ncbi:PREDICTED: uncharacterized protein LOC109581296 [Amphimedon queenslandica]|uniref:Ig-like domain-containing protein n=1 Tax=Amphimedon queenslandica TaxID=400682 RepID=A0AAN0J2A6_AMPQE|nr:PREDICTED: uncharacterized protein LOC109581296 [Amphimedon queenslandica]|eukprot:XP_019850862.1 PREDICTED: uncharacterized protein LOC109581296 [Amphimedon queenslandica]